MWSGNWPLLPMIPMKRQIAPASRSEWSAPLLSAYAFVPLMLNVPAAKNMMMMPIISPMSPVRVVRNAFSAALEFSCSSQKCPISANEQRPTPSQPDEHHECVVGHDEQEHRRGEEAEHRVVLGEADFVSHVRDRVDVHEQRDQRDDEEHHHHEAVDPCAHGRT